MLAVFIVSVVFATILAVADGSFQQDPANFMVFVLGFGAFMVVGALVVAHRPGNPIGWIFSAIALLAFTGGLAGEYATYALLTRPGSLPAATFAAWYTSWPWYPTLALALVFTPLLFPTGRLLSPRWRSLAWLAGAAFWAGRLPAYTSGRHRLSRLRGPDRVPAGCGRDRDPALSAVRHRPADQPHPWSTGRSPPCSLVSTPS